MRMGVIQTNDPKGLVSQGRSELATGAGEVASQKRGALQHPSRAGLHQPGQAGDGVLGQVRQQSLQMRPPAQPVELVGGRRQPIDGQPGPGAISSAMALPVWCSG
jgi:hypothetical protein